MEGNIELSKQEYLRLLVRDEKLRRLEVGGVNNWEWHGDSLNPDGEDGITEFSEKLKKQMEQNG